MADILPDSPNLAAALAHAVAGRPVFPCAQSKRPAIPKSRGGRGFLDATTDQAQIRAWWTEYPDALIGMPTGRKIGVFVLDVDVRGEKRGDETLADLERRHGKLPDTVESITASGGRHLLYRHPRGNWKIASRAENLGPGLDVRGDGGYIILPPSRLADGRSYEWEGSSDPDEGETVADAPQWLLALVGTEGTEQAQNPVADNPHRTLTSRRDAESALNALDPDCAYDDWLMIGMALHSTGADWAFTLWDTWSARGKKYPQDGTMVLGKKWRSFSTDGSGRIGPGTLFSLAMQAGWQRPEPHRAQGPLPPGPPLEAYADDCVPDGPPNLRVVAGTDYDARPEVLIRNGELPLAVDSMEDHLIRGGAEIYQHGTRLVRVGKWEASKGPMQRPSGSGILIDITPDWLIDQSTRHINFQRWDKRSNAFKPVDCPTRLAASLLGRTGSWRFPALTGFCDSPTLDRTGRVVSASGYDPPSGLYLSHPPDLPPMETTGQAAAAGAGETLYCAVDTFPFVTSADASSTLALIMTALLRRVLPAAPIGCISAATPGTGKSLLADVISVLCTGRQAAVMAIGQTQEELEKRIDSVLLKGDALCSFDNVDRAIKSDVLCQVATQPVKSIRVLALSKIVEAPTNVALLMTGNNITLVGDLVRRCVVVNLDAGCERPELREFDRDAIEHVLARRAEFIAAALTISKAYLDAGAPKIDALPFGSFEVWDRMIRRPLIWAGWPDPLQSAEAMREQDHELAAMRDLLAAWHEVHPDPLTAAELSELIRARQADIGDRWRPLYPDLTEAAVQVFGDLAKWGARELGYRLRAMQGRLFGGMRIKRGPKGKRGVSWRVEIAQG